MTKEALQQTEELVGRSKVLLSCIETCDHNIEHYEDLKRESKEILIIDSSCRMSEEIKRIVKDWYGSDSTVPIYTTGERKNAIFDLLIQEENKFKEEHQKEFDKL